MGMLEEFYYLAVSGNTGRLNKMHDAAWVSFYHALSTHEKPQHNHCPVGADSWCFYQKALATGLKPGEQNFYTLLLSGVAVHVLTASTP